MILLSHASDLSDPEEPRRRPRFWRALHFLGPGGVVILILSAICLLQIWNAKWAAETIHQQSEALKIEREAVDRADDAVKSARADMEHWALIVQGSSRYVKLAYEQSERSEAALRRARRKMRKMQEILDVRLYAMGVLAELAENCK